MRGAAAFFALTVLCAPANFARADDAWFESGRAQIAAARAALEARGAAPARARNLILFIGDGMGVSTVTAARILEGQQRGGSGEAHQLSFERFPQLGLLKVYNTNQQVPDSAGTMTAIMSGVKTKAGVLGVNARVVFDDHASVAASRTATLFEQAETRGLLTGLVSSTELTHATPAACYAHAPNRAWTHDAALPAAARDAGFPDIARQLLEFPHGDGIDVMLGGGRAHFLPAREEAAREMRGLRRDGRDLPARWQSAARGRAVVWNARELRAQNPRRTRQLLGLFAPAHLAFHIDRRRARPSEPTLTQMTEAALRFLTRRERGFVLMVEGGRIDHAHHFGNASRALHETIELAAAVTRALELTDASQTLVVVTADHSHPLTLAGYTARGNPILGWVNAPQKARGAGDGDGGETKVHAQDALGNPYTTLQYAAGPGHHALSDAQAAGPKTFPHFPQNFHAPSESVATENHATQNSASGAREKSSASTKRASAHGDPQARDYLQHAGTPLTVGVHSGEDVAVYATGPGAELFNGVREQHTLYHAMVEALGWNDARAP